MRIAVVGQPRDHISFPMRTGASVGIVCYELARRVARHHEVVLYAPMGKGQPAVGTDPSGVTVRRVPRVLRTLHKALELAHGMGHAETLYSATSLFHREYFTGVARDLRRRPVDIVHLQSFAQHAGLLRDACPRARIVLHLHDESMGQLGPPAIASLLEPVDVVLAVSDFVAARVAGRVPHLAHRFRTLHNGADVDRFAPALAAGATGRASRHGGPVLLYVGRVSPEKGVHVLAAAFARVQSVIPEARLEIVGPPGLIPYGFIRMIGRDPAVPDLGRFYGRSLPERVRRQILNARTSYVRDLRRTLPEGAAKRVSFRGGVAYDDLPDLYRSADVFVHPTVCNEQPLPVLEAMASGLPVVASRAGGIPEMIVDRESGFLVERGQAEALASAIVSVLGDEAGRRAMGSAGRERAVALFGWDRAAECLVAAYEDLVLQAPAARAS